MMFRLIACPYCGADVIELPIDGGPEVFDADEFALGDVPEADQFVIAAMSARTSTEPQDLPATCLRRHLCSQKVEPLPRLNSVDPVVSHADYVALRKIRTTMALYRAQVNSEIRDHPGRRNYAEVVVPPRLAMIGRLDPDHCALCGRAFEASAEPLRSGQVEGSLFPLRTCNPACPRI